MGLSLRRRFCKRREELVNILTRTLLKFDEIVFAYLYGSYARRENHKFSDIDIAVYLKHYNPKTYLDILGAINIDIDIDLKILNAPPIFRYKVIKEGVLLFCKDGKAHKNFVFHTLIEALEYIETYIKIILLRYIDS